MNTKSANPQPVTIVATSNGLVLATPHGEYLIQSTATEAGRDLDPVDLLGIQDSAPQALVLQTGQFAH